MEVNANSKGQTGRKKKNYIFFIELLVTGERVLLPNYIMVCYLIYFFNSLISVKSRSLNCGWDYVLLVWYELSWKKNPFLKEFLINLDLRYL